MPLPRLRPVLNLTVFLLCLLTSITFASSPFATSVVSYNPQPGQFTSNPAFNDPARALGPPLGGTPAQPDNTKLVTLGREGGNITLAFGRPVRNRAASPGNPRALDLILFGNAFYVGGNPARRWAEPGIIEVSADVNNNTLADDPFYVIAGPYLLSAPAPTLLEALLPASIFAPGGLTILDNPLGPDTTTEGVYAYADCTPTLLLGDLDADGESDNPALDPARFYTSPDNPLAVGLTPFSGGGDAIDLSWAVDPITRQTVQLAQIDFVRVRSGLSSAQVSFGEASTELGGVAIVQPRSPADIAGPGQSLGPDGERTADDIIVFLSWFIAQRPLADIAGPGQSLGPDGEFTADDLIVFMGWFLLPAEEP